MKKIKMTLLILTSGILGSITAQATVHDSLWHYMEIAIKNNPGILSKTDEYKAALYKIPQVASLPDPELNMSLFLTPMEIISGKQVADLELMQMFPWFGTLKYARDEMSLMAKAAYESLRDAKLQLLYEVQSSWYDLYRTHRNLILSEKNLALLQRIEQLALLKYKTGTSAISPPIALATQQNPITSSGGMSGMGRMEGSNTTTNTGGMTSSGTSGIMMGGSDTGLSSMYRLQMEKYGLTDNIATLHESIKSKQSRFNALLNQPALTPVFVPDSIQQDIPELALFSPSVDSLFSGQPMLEMLQYEYASLKAKGRMVDKMGYPMLGVGVGYSVIAKSENSTSMMNGMDMLMPMIKISIPIYRKKYKAMRSETEMLQSATQNSLKETQNMLLAGYYEGLERYENAGRQIDLYNMQAALLQKILNLSIKEFSNSGNGLTDLLRTRQELYSYELKKEETIAELNASVAYLRRITGKHTTNKNIHIK